MPSLMFGSFNPPTYAHLKIVKSLQAIKSNPVIVIPNPHSPDKQLPSFEIRTKMLKRLLGHLPNTHVIDDVKQLETPEIAGEHPYLTFAKAYLKDRTHKPQTFNVLQVAYGSDAARKVLERKPQRLTHPDLNAVIFPREGRDSDSYHALRRKLNELDHCTATLQPPEPSLHAGVSSTKLRELIKQGDFKAAQRYTSKGILNIIQHAKLYV